MSIKEKLISNSMFLLLHWAVDTAMFMLYWLILAKVLDPSSLGVVSVANQIVVLLSTFGVIGLDMTSFKLISEYVKKDDKDSLQGIINVSLKTVAAMSIILGAGFILYTFAFPDALGLDPQVAILVAGSILFMALSTQLDNIYLGFQNVKRVFLTRLVSDIMLVGMVLLLTRMGIGYIGAIAALFLSFFIMFITRISPKLFAYSKKPQVDMKGLLSYSIPAFVVTILSSIFNSTQFIILAAIKTTEITGMFSVPMKIAVVLTVVPSILSRGLFPISSGLSVESGAKEKQRYLLSLVFRYGTMIVVFLAALMILFSKQLILFYSKPDFLPSMEYMPMLVIGAALMGLSNQFVLNLYAIREPVKYRNSYIISTVMYLGSSVLLTYYFSAVGMAAAYMVSGLTMFAVTYFYIRRTLGMRMPVKELAKLFVALAISSAFMYALSPYASGMTRTSLISIAGGGLYMVLLLPLRFYVKEDVKILEHMSEKVPVPAVKKLIAFFTNVLSGFIDE